MKSKRRNCFLRKSICILCVSYCGMLSESLQLCPPVTSTTTRRNAVYQQQSLQNQLSLLACKAISRSSLHAKSSESLTDSCDNNTFYDPIRQQRIKSRLMYDQHKYSRGETFLQATRAKATSSTSINNSIAAVAAAGTTTKLSRKKKKKPQINNGQINNGPKITHGIRAKRLSGSVAAGAWYQRDEMMRHDILNREEEVILGQKIVKAKQMRELMISLVEEKKVNEEIIMEAEMMRKLNINDYDYDGIGTYRNENDFDDDDFGQLDNGMDPRTMEQTGYAHLQYDGSILDNRGDQRIASTLVRDGSKLIASSFDADLKYLTQEDVQTILKIKGGKNELRKILTDGARARNKLMRCNFRLVVSVGKKWMGRSNDNGKISDRYNGSWDKPSLDEVIQEGMLGLARAVDKYDPGRGLRFSTYSTHWITSYVRQCFQNAATGCLKVPSQLHDIKSTYKAAVKRYIEASESIPSEEIIADEIGVSLSRLRKAIRVTESLVSIDEPIYAGGNAAFKGSGAGGDLSGENTLLISDRLKCSEIAPEDYVEYSFLRQTLETAMAAELSPYERDILRLRLGLDDGQSRTVKEVVEECGGDTSISEVRSAERRAFKKLRSPNAVHAHNLVAYLEMADIDIDGFER